MLQIVQKHLSLIFVIVVSLGFVGFALAQEGTVPANVDASVTAQPKLPVKPLDLVRQRALEMKQNTDAKADLRAETKIQLQNASSGPGRDIARDRYASSTLVRKMKELVRQHAGLIKERFSLALRQFERLSGRIETRLEKMKAEGIATASVEAELEVAKAANIEAKADVQAVADFVASIDDSADRAAVRTELQALIKDAQTSIREAHQAFQKVVRSLVALAKENKPEAGASVEVDTSASSQISE